MTIKKYLSRFNAGHLLQNIKNKRLYKCISKSISSPLLENYFLDELRITRYRVRKIGSEVVVNKCIF